MKLLKKILLFVGVVLVVLIIVSQFLPSTFHVERSAVIAAKAEAIHPWVGNLKKWPEWTAWTVAKDPSLVFSYEGPEEGVGAISKWEGKKMGQGQMKVVESDAAKGLKCDLSFDHGKYLSIGTIAYAATEGGTKVTWSMDGKVSRNPLDRFFSLLMDKMGGPDFEEGLRNLKAKVEAK